MRLPCRVCRMCITRRYNYTGISLIAIIVCLSYLYRFFIGSNFNSISLSYLLEDRDGKSYDNNLCCVLTTEYVLIYCTLAGTESLRGTCHAIGKQSI